MIIKNDFVFDGGLLFVFVDRRDGDKEVFMFDSNDYGKLVGKRFYVKNRKLDLVYKDNGKVIYVKDLIMDFPNNRVTFTNKNNHDLRKSNLKCFGIRNKFWVEGDTLIVEAQDGSEFYFDAEDYIFLEQLDARISKNNFGYPMATVDRQIITISRYLMECYFGDEVAGMEIDHINGLVNDNRKGNLRILTRSDNLKSQHKTCAKAGFPNVTFINGKPTVRFKSAPHYNRVFEKVTDAIRYSYVVRPFVYGDKRGTVGSLENMKKALKENR